MVALPQSKLKQEWVRRGIANVARDLVDNRHVASDCGPLFHGMHALVIYRQRTVPGYLVPQFNSQIKMADRGKKKAPAAASAAKSMTKTDKPAAKVADADSTKVVPAGRQTKPEDSGRSASSKVESGTARK